MLERPFLAAHWSDLLLLNFAVPPEVLHPLVPPGVEPDLHDGQAYVSIVGFRFHTVRVLGMPVPGHTRFPEINLRYYVRRLAGDEFRRGVVFVREIVPRRAVAIIANWLYHENYVRRPMPLKIETSGTELGPGDTVEYAWQNRPCPADRELPSRWNRLAARVAAPLQLPLRGSLEEFFVEHYWGYARGRDAATREYRVMHPPWKVARADHITWDCDVPASYPAPLAEYLASPPANALVAVGSPVQVYRGRRF
jgi:uncharacterized protein